MATSMVSKVFVFFLIFLPLVFLSSEARLLPKSSPIMAKRINTELLLRDLVINLGVREYQHRRSMQGGRLERLSPAGPDPQHH
ncbi:hypothetical protein VNO80_26865 [Phaseolus coccineus]|uniref:Uncharacterized protein n=1 Tax=Phaseolus coccineus TaxID=3886 RepID=A0AAN9LJ32_PHACN